jgi:Family of unknown function (DUF6231)
MMLRHLSSVIAALHVRLDDKRILVISRSLPPKTPERYFPGSASLEWRNGIRSINDLDRIERADLGLVFDQLEHMDKSDAVQLLGRLRDRHCGSVLMHCKVRNFSNQELLALGYIEQNGPYGGGRYFWFDPGLFFERRDWNSPEHWAHPENFKKNRW